MIHPAKQVGSVYCMAARPRFVLFSKSVRLVASLAFSTPKITRGAQVRNFAKADNTIALALSGLAGIQPGQLPSVGASPSSAALLDYESLREIWSCARSQMEIPDSN
jgi:hypothetical protein